MSPGFWGNLTKICRCLVTRSIPFYSLGDIDCIFYILCPNRLDFLCQLWKRGASARNCVAPPFSPAPPWFAGMTMRWHRMLCRISEFEPTLNGIHCGRYYCESSLTVGALFAWWKVIKHIGTATDTLEKLCSAQSAAISVELILVADNRVLSACKSATLGTAILMEIVDFWMSMIHFCSIWYQL